jgi:hypothetical protein
MEVTLLATQSRERSLLSGVRRVLDGADEAYLCVAFASMAGVQLIKGVLEPIRKKEGATLLVTTTFGSTTPEGLVAARKAGVDVRFINLPKGTYHPKVYVGRKHDRVTAVVGSANLTGGLVNNVEMATLLEGDMRERELAFTLQWARDIVQSDAANTWVPRGTVDAELLDPLLFSHVEDAVRVDPVFRTVQRGAKNVVVDATLAGLWVETEKSRSEGQPAQLVPAWMIQFAWDYLLQHGELTNKDLRDGHLSVKRSSFVCALLARLPGVQATNVGVRLAPA